MGGKTAKQGAYPFIAALGAKNPNNVSDIIYICGGSLVSRDQITNPFAHISNAPGVNFINVFTGSF